ncbi:MAG: S24/S26 family peptidase [Paludibacteraceae bacterium]|nr:S24/S26 family peptidase [Paludibacteraceae bacterium]
MQLPNEIFIPEVARLVSEGKQVVFTPTGQSMRPYIEGGVDSVTLVKPEALAVGDIVLAEIQPQHYVLHRIYGLQGEQVTLMGDGNLQGCEHCHSKDVLAKVSCIRSPKGRRKPLTKAWLWRHMLHSRRLWLKVYRHVWI